MMKENQGGTTLYTSPIMENICDFLKKHEPPFWCCLTCKQFGFLEYTTDNHLFPFCDVDTLLREQPWLKSTEVFCHAKKISPRRVPTDAVAFYASQIGCSKWEPAVFFDHYSRHRMVRKPIPHPPSAVPIKEGDPIVMGKIETTLEYPYPYERAPLHGIHDTGKIRMAFVDGQTIDISVTVIPPICDPHTWDTGGVFDKGKPAYIYREDMLFLCAWVAHHRTPNWSAKVKAEYDMVKHQWDVLGCQFGTNKSITEPERELEFFQVERHAKRVLESSMCTSIKEVSPLPIWEPPPGAEELLKVVEGAK